MRKLSSLFLVLGLSLGGCAVWGPNPLNHEEPLRTFMILGPQASQKQLQFIDEMLAHYDLARTTDRKSADFQIILSAVVHEPIDYFIEQTQRSLFKNYRSTLDVQVRRNDTQEIIFEKRFVSLETLKDDVSFYKEQDLALAHLQWRQQRNLFDQLGAFLEKLCHGTLAGLS